MNKPTFKDAPSNPPDWFDVQASISQAIAAGFHFDEAILCAAEYYGMTPSEMLALREDGDHE